VEMDKIGHLLNGSGLQEKREGGRKADCITPNFQFLNPVFAQIP